MTTALKSKKCVTCGKVGGKHTDYCPQGLENPTCPRCGKEITTSIAVDGEEPTPVCLRCVESQVNARLGEVDGEPAIIDGTVPKPEPLIARPTLEEAMAEVDSAEKIEREFNEKLEIAKSAYKIAKDRLERAESVALEAYRDRSQMALGEAS